MGKQGDGLKVNGMVSKSTTNDLDNFNSKKKNEIVARRGKSTNSTSLVEEQLRAQQLCSFNASLQNAKKKKEEEERKQIEDLKA